MNNISGRHWVFIIGIISAVIVSRWSEGTASNIVILLLFGGAGIWLKDISDVR
jgi:hypothetical protein